MIKPTRRQLLGGMAALGGAYAIGLATPRLVSYAEAAPFRRAVRAALPPGSISTGLDIGRPVAKLVEAGAIDRAKFIKAHERRGPVPEWVSRALDGKQQELILSAKTAPYNLNLLWPLGLATKAAFNDDSPLNGADLPNFASTGGWTLGKKNNGAAYFNAVETLPLTSGQASIVRGLAEKVFRPCCNNSTFFQDCNHGSAMLGLMELAAANGRGSAEILEMARTANGYWYPQQYVEMALYFDAVEDLSWKDVPPARLLSMKFSSVSGWQRNVRGALRKAGYFPQRQRNGGGSGCAV